MWNYVTASRSNVKKHSVTLKKHSKITLLITPHTEIVIAKKKEGWREPARYLHIEAHSDLQLQLQLQLVC